VLPRVESLLEGDELELLDAGVEDADWVQEEFVLVLAGVVDEED